MKYKLNRRKNPQETSKPGKLYATPVLTGRLTAEMLAEQISGRSSLTLGDISNVIKNVIDMLPIFMLLGRSVELEGLGLFKISFSSLGVDDEKEFDPHSIRNIKVIFRPSPELIKRIKDRITFERVTSTEIPPETPAE